MPIDDSFLKKEAAKRRLMVIMLVVLLFNFGLIGVLFGTGYFYEEPFISRILIYSEAVVFGVLYFVLRKKFKSGA